MTTGDTAGRALLNQRQKNEGPQRPLKTGSLYCPPPPTHPREEHLITQVTFCMSALNLPLTGEPLQTWGRQGALGGIIAPAALCCFDVRPSPTPPPASPPLPSPSPPPHPPVRPWHCYREAIHWQAESRNAPLSSPLSQPHANTLSRKLNRTHKHTPRLYKITGVLSLLLMQDMMRSIQVKAIIIH